MRTVTAWIGFALVAACSISCSTSGLAIRTDERLEILEPEDRAEVGLPVAIRWTIDDFEVTGPSDRVEKDAGYFAVFVDQAPQPPGETIEWLFRDDDECRALPACPDEAFLADRDIFTTSETSVVIDSLPTTDEEREIHNVTIVLLDGKGRRIGESAFPVEFRVERDG